MATPIVLPDTRGLIASLRSDVCPICQGTKRPSATMCARDYHRLPADLKRALYARVGAGYEEALTAAMLHLRTTSFHLPPQMPSAKTKDR